MTFSPEPAQNLFGGSYRTSMSDGKTQFYKRHKSPMCAGPFLVRMDAESSALTRELYVPLFAGPASRSTLTNAVKLPSHQRAETLPTWNLSQSVLRLRSIRRFIKNLGKREVPYGWIATVEKPSDCGIIAVRRPHLLLERLQV